MPAKTSWITLPFMEQIGFLKQKVNVKTEGWTDVYGPEHDTQFMVAGVNRDDLLADLRKAVERIPQGQTLEGFRKELSGLIARYGWSFNGDFNWRSRVIFETNLRTSYMAGRFAQLMAMRDTHPYWMYVHSDAVEEPRQEHLDWDRLVLRWDDPWWEAHFPVNAWGCQCSVQALTEDDLRAMGKTGPDTAPPVNYVTRIIGKRSPGGPRTVIVPEGIDPGFEYTPGRSLLISEVPPPRGGNPLSIHAIPHPETAPESGLPPLPAPAKEPEAWRGNAVDSFLQDFQAVVTPAAFKDLSGHRLVIGREMFTHPDDDSGFSVSGTSLQWLSQAIREPDEIWAQVVYLKALHRAVVHYRYLTRIQSARDAAPFSVVFETGSDGWAGNVSMDDTLLQALRQGVLLYRREGGL
ncbi:hypothetical protein M8W91_002802 [Salmonella enterica]|nr:hypothetical protein [Salmonella enterica]EJF5856677.1 hypothetical protein [Salmonella enterica]EJF5948042.1 hypothetical protein [Salmonella enterica]EJF6158027.1 hypothetical protein [Salmonella enterica]EJF6377307.1 hypothetical protein [Salmonella enterica]